MPFLILGNKIDVANAASEDELRLALGLSQYTSGKGKVDLKGQDIRPHRGLHVQCGESPALLGMKHPSALVQAPPIACQTRSAW